MSREISISSAKNVKLITLSDTVNIDYQIRGIVISGAGNVVLVNEDDTITTLSTDELASGVIHPLSPKRINATGTTVTAIYGVF